jgi:hypothetical protein
MPGYADLDFEITIKARLTGAAFLVIMISEVSL